MPDSRAVSWLNEAISLSVELGEVLSAASGALPGVVVAVADGFAVVATCVGPVPSLGSKVLGSTGTPAWRETIRPPVRMASAAMGTRYFQLLKCMLDQNMLNGLCTGSLVSTIGICSGKLAKSLSRPSTGTSITPLCVESMAMPENNSSISFLSSGYVRWIEDREIPFSYSSRAWVNFRSVVRLLVSIFFLEKLVQCSESPHLQLSHGCFFFAKLFGNFARGEIVDKSQRDDFSLVQGELVYAFVKYL